MSDDEDKKPEKGEPMNIKIQDASGEETHFKVKKHTKFEKIFSVYSSAEIKFLVASGVES